MTGIRPIDSLFRAGDEVFLAEGTYQGTTGIFINLRADSKWADIKESTGAIRSHPVAWLALVPNDKRTGVRKS